MKMVNAKGIWLVLSALLIISCIPPKDKAIALRAIDQHHARFNDSKFQEIYDDSTPEHKQAISREEFVESFRAMRQGEGRVLASEELAADYHSSPEDVRINLLMLVTFEKGQAREEFTYRILEGKAALAAYRFLGS